MSATIAFYLGLGIEVTGIALAAFGAGFAFGKFKR